MVRIFAHGSHPVQVESLTVEDVFHQTFFQHFHGIFVTSGPDKPGFPVVFPQDVPEIISNGQRRAAGTGLIRKSVMDQPRTFTKLCRHFGDQQPVGAFGDLGSSGDDLFCNAYLVHFHHIIHIISLDLPRNGRERNQIIGNNDHLIGIL